MARLDHFEAATGDVLFARHMQEQLWAIAANQQAWVPFAGISAMPSMHLSMATLCACLWWTYGPLGRVAGLVYVGLIQLGSVVLAWHYSIDGYVSIVGTLAIWRLSGRLVDGKRC
jgi:hypothetical protein